MWKSHIEQRFQSLISACDGNLSASNEIFWGKIKPKLCFITLASFGWTEFNHDLRGLEFKLCITALFMGWLELQYQATLWKVFKNHDQITSSVLQLVLVSFTLYSSGFIILFQQQYAVIAVIKLSCQAKLLLARLLTNGMKTFFRQLQLKVGKQQILDIAPLINVHSWVWKTAFGSSAVPEPIYIRCVLLAT